MSEPSPVPDPYALMGIIKNQDGSITRDPTRFPRVPATPDPFPQVISKDVLVNPSNSTWMRLYVPTTALNDSVSSKKLPLVLYYHGGGFITCSFDLKLFHEFCNRLARECNVVVASASYRLAPEFKLPAAYEDGVDALKCLRDSPHEWIKSYADISNVFLMGTNSGGNLAYNVGLGSAFADLSPLRICGLILHAPLFGGEERCESELRHVDHQVFPLALTDLCWNLCLPDGENRDHEYSNPTVGVGDVGPDDVMRRIERLGWKVMVIGDEDLLLIDRQRDVADLFKKKGVVVVERFTGDDGGAESTTLFASIRNFIYSPPPLRFSLKEAYINGPIAYDP
ncbi:unnamed protein product [Eruca vesicaria subsp. sativa]|uniref:Alpha/beta hydrolase fold-3 domain-containing protein n=1 Tax=Eruca vesicaria subsp. sativa TaxID=29727 RepID=A0ABC8KZQ0_ERUVS|nr:unnamed protein product [Eruca vesicaria subsp. sativa]